MASWKKSLKSTYKDTQSSFVTLPDSPDKSDNCGESEGAAFEDNRNDLSLDKSEELDGPKSSMDLQDDDHSLAPVELNCCLKLKKTSIISTDCQSEMEEKEYELLPHFSLLEHSKNLGDQQQCFSKDMLCTVVKDMELSSKVSESDFMEGCESIESILHNLSQDNIEAKCISILNFAKRCLLKEFYSQLDEADVHSLMLKMLPDILSFNDFAFCCSIFLCVLSQYPKTKDEKKLMEQLLVKFMQATINRKKSDAFFVSGNDTGGYSMRSLPENMLAKSQELCKLMAICDEWEFPEINITFLNCVAVKNIFTDSSKGAQRSHPDILRCIMDRFQEGVQQLCSKKQPSVAELNDFCINLRVIWKCLQTLEQASFLHPENQKYLASYENSAISRNSNRLLAICMKYLFYDAIPQSFDAQVPESDMNCNKEVQCYLKLCLVSTLKVLLNISHRCKEAVIKVGAIDGLMEKLLMCILNIGSQKSEEQFELSILCLEILINLIEPCWPNRKTFAILCLKKFRGSSDGQMYAVEHLIEILTETLNEISLLERLKDEATKEVDSSSETAKSDKKCDDAKSDIVVKAAGKHMEKSMICTYISILLGFFVDIKKTFRDLVYDKMPCESVKQAIVVSEQFLSFVALTEGANQNSVRSLNVMLSTLRSLREGR